MHLFSADPKIINFFVRKTLQKFFLFLILFFKAREQIENENGQQLDSSKKAMDEEDEDLLANVAKKVLES